MFGFMVISKEEYDNLKAEINKLTNELKDLQYENDKTILENKNLKFKISAFKDCLRQADEINSDIAEENGCKVGVWCADCIHGKNVHSYYHHFRSSDNFTGKYLNCKYYCTKHIYETCPNWESRNSK